MTHRAIGTFVLLLSILLSFPDLRAQPVTDGQGDLGIGTLEPDGSALLDLTSTTKGLLLPRMTTVQRDAIISPANGLMIFNTDDSIIQWNFGTFLSPDWHMVVGTDSSGLLQAPLAPGAIWYGDINGMAAELPAGAANTIPMSDGSTLHYGLITNSNVDAAAAIAGTKINPNFGTQNISTTGNITGANLSGANLAVSGNATIAGNSSVGGNGSVAGNISIGGNLSNGGNATLATDPGASATVGNPTGTTSLNGSNVNIGANASTIDIGNATSTTTIDGTVLFTSAPSLPLAEGALLVGDNTNTATELPIGAANSIPQSNGTTLSYGLITNANVDAAAAIAGTKINPDFGGQNVSTTGNITGADLSGANLAASGNATVNGNATVGGNASVSGDASVTGNATVNGNLWNGGNANLATAAGSNATVGNATGTMNIDGSDVNVGANASTIDIGNATSTTTIDGTVVFTNPISQPLTEGSLFIGDNSNSSSELTIGAANTLPMSDGTTLGYGLITNSNVDAAAAIAGSKINPDFGAQNVSTTGDISGDDLNATGNATVTGNASVTGNLSNGGNANLATTAGSNATVGNATGTTNIDGSDVNVGANASTIDIGNPTSTTTIDGTVVFTNPISLPLNEGSLFIGDNTNTATELPVGAANTIPMSDGTTLGYGLITNANVDAAAAIAGTKINPDFGAQNMSTTGDISGDDLNAAGNASVTGDLSNGGNTNLATTAGSNATVGNATGTTNIDGSDVNVGANASTIDIGNPTSTTTIDGTVVFTNPISQPLTEGSLFIGDNSNTATELPVGAANTLPMSDGTTLGYGLITNANVDAAAAIAGSKINPDFGAQNLSTTGSLNGSDITASGNATFGDGSGDNVAIDVTGGSLDIDGLTQDNSQTNVMVIDGTGKVYTRTVASLGGAVTTDGSLTGNGTVGSPLAVNLGNANTWTAAQTYNTVDINGGTVDGTTIGGTTPAAATVTNLTATGNTILGNGDNVSIDVTGNTLDIDGLTQDNAQTNVMVIDGTGKVYTRTVASLGGAVTTDGSLTGNGTVGSPLAVNLGNANTWTAAQTYNTVVINGGTVDGTTIGGSSAASATVTTLTATSNSTLGNGNGDNITLNASDPTTGGTVGINVTNGTLDIDGLTQDNAQTNVMVVDGTGKVYTRTAGSLSGTVNTNSSLSGNGSAGSPLSINLGNANTWTATQTINSVVIGSGTINNTTIGATTPAAATVTSLSATGNSTLGNGNGDNITLNASDPTTGGTVGINVTNGTLDIDGLTQDNTQANVMVVDGTGKVFTRTAASLSGSSGWSLTGNASTTPGTNFLGTTDLQDLVLKTNGVERVRIGSTGNLLLNNNGTASELRFAEPSGSGTEYTAFKAGAQSGNITYTLPTSAGALNTTLTTDASGNLSWTNPNTNGSLGSDNFKRKTADETLNNVTTLQNDDHLSFSVAANQTYELEGFLYVRGTSNNSELQIALDIPNGATMKLTYVAYDGANNIRGGGFVTIDATGSAAIDISSSTSTNVAVMIRGMVVMGGTAGTAQFMWASVSNANGSTMTVEQDSFMKLLRIE